MYIQHNRRALCLSLAGLAALAMLGPVAAENLPIPTGQIILEVSGKIGRTNRDNQAVFDKAMLEKIGISTLRTTTTWTDGVVTFEGVPFSVLLDTVNAQGTKVSAIAVNDYAIELDTAELRRYPVLLAMRMNGQEMRIRDKGPIWVVYPRDDFPELASEDNNFKWIWQLKELKIH